MTSVPLQVAPLRVVVATPLSEEHADLVRRLEPRIDLVHDAELAGPPTDDWMEHFDRPTELQAAYEAYVDSADVLYGVPDQSGRALARTVAANPGLRWVHTIPAGGGQQVRAARLDRAALDRILFTTSAGVHAVPLAEFAVFGVLAGAKLLPWLLTEQAAHRWAPRRVMPIAADQTVAVVGLGSIGRLTAQKLAGLGYTVVGVHRRQVEVDGVAEIFPMERLAEVAGMVDAMVVALPGTDATRGIVSRAVLEAAKPGMTLVNVGRGTTVDEPALIDALAGGPLGLAVLDVTAVEPLAADSPLWDLPNVVLAPHTAAISPHEPRLIAELFAENARRLLDGEELLNRVDTDETGVGALVGGIFVAAALAADQRRAVALSVPARAGIGVAAIVGLGGILLALAFGARAYVRQLVTLAGAAPLDVVLLYAGVVLVAAVVVAARWSSAGTLATGAITTVVALIGLAAPTALIAAAGGALELRRALEIAVMGGSLLLIGLLLLVAGLAVRVRARRGAGMPGIGGVVAVDPPPPSGPPSV